MPPQKPQPKTVKGTLASCPCPWCGKANDLSEINSMNALDRDAELDCDHCGRIMRVANVATVTVVTVYQSPRDAEIRARRARQGR